MKRGFSSSRRWFLLAFVALGFLGFALFWPRAERVIVAILRRRVGFLDVDPKSFHDFAEGYLQRKSRAAKQLAWVAPLAPLLALWSPYAWLPMGHPVRRLEDNVVSNYLQSTDFFVHGADESRHVHYTGFAMVQDRNCSNPFAVTYHSRNGK